MAWRGHYDRRLRSRCREAWTINDARGEDGRCDRGSTKQILVRAAATSVGVVTEPAERMVVYGGLRAARSGA